MSSYALYLIVEMNDDNKNNLMHWGHILIFFSTPEKNINTKISNSRKFISLI